MASVDERIVSISFDNTKFEANIAKTIASLLKLNDALKLVGAVNGLQSIETASNRVKMTTAQTSAANLKKTADFTANAKSLKDVEAASNQVKLSGAKSAADDTSTRFSRMADTAKRGLENVKNILTRSGKDAGDALQIRDAKGQFAAIEQASHQVKLRGIHNGIAGVKQGFTVLKGAAAVAFGNIAASAAAYGAKTAKSFVSPIKQGFEEYEGNINATQTILANVKGQKGGDLKSVNKVLAELNTYADKTIYKFGDMTKGASIFTAAGVNVKEMVPSIKGVSNLLAVSGATADKAAPFMNQMSQALASGKVGVMDWQSATAAGVSGKMFQKAIVQEAMAMGTLKGKVEGLDDPMKELRINGMSFRDSIKAKPGEESFFTSKVLGGVFKNLSGDMTEADLVAKGYTKSQAKAAMASAKTALEAATVVKTLSGLKDTLKEAVGSGWAKSFQILFGDFGQAKKLFTSINTVLGGMIQNSATARNKLLGEWAKMGGRTDLLDGLKQSFYALRLVMKAVSAGFREVFPKSTAKDLANMSEGFKSFAINLKQGVLKNSALIKAAFAGVFAVFSIGFQIVKRIVGVFLTLGGAVGGAAGGGFKAFVIAVSAFLVSVDKALKSGKSFREVIATLPGVLRAPLTLLADLAAAIKNFFSGGKGSGKQIGGEFDLIRQKMTPLKTLTEKLGEAWQSFKDKVTDATTAIRPGIDKIKAAFSGFGASFTQAFNNIDYAAVLSGIQTALLGGIVIMFKKFFTGGLGGVLGVSGTFNELGKTFGSVTGYLKTMQLEVKANVLLKIAIALGILTLSIVALSGIDGPALDRSMSALALAFVQLSLAMKYMTGIAVTSGKGAALMPILAAGMILMAIAIRVLVSSVKALSQLDYEELGKGLGAVAVLFGVMAVAAGPLGAAGAKIVLAGVGMLLIATAMRVLSKAIVTLSQLSWEELGKGLATIGVSLAIVLVAVTLIPVKLPLIAYGLISFSAAMTILAKAIQTFGSMDWGELARGLTAMAGGLGIIIIAVMALPKTLILQAAGLLLLATSVKIIASALVSLAKLSIAGVLTGLVGLAGALAILAVGLIAMQGSLRGSAALLLATTGLSALVPVLLTLGTMSIAQLAQGLGAIAIGFGIFVGATLLLAPAIPVLIAMGVAIVLMGIGIGALSAGVAKLVEAFVLLIDAMGKLGGGGSLEAITASFGAFFSSIGKFVTGVPAAIGKFLTGLGDMSVGFASVIPKFVQGMVALIGAILDVIVKTAPQFVQGMIVLLNGLLDVIIITAPKIGQAFLVLLVTALKILSTGVPQILAVGIRLIKALLTGIAGNIFQITVLAGSIVVNFLRGLALKLPEILRAGGNLLLKTIQGIDSAIPRVIPAVIKMVTTFLTKMAAEMPRLIAAGAKFVVSILRGIANNVGPVVKAGFNLVTKLIKGIGDGAGEIVKAAAETAVKFVRGVAKEMLKLVDDIGKIVLNFLTALNASIKKYEKPIIDAGVDIASSLIDGAIKGLGEGARRLKDKALSVFSALPKGVKKLLGINSPSRVFADLGQGVVEGFANGIGDTRKTDRAVSSMAYGVIDGYKSIFQIQSPSKVTKMLGEYVGAGFAEGLTGSEDKITGAFESLNEKLSTELDKARELVKANTEKIAEIQGRKSSSGKSRKATADERQEIGKLKRARDEAKASIEDIAATRETANKSLAFERAQLLKTSRSYEEYGEKVKAAEDVLKSATETRDSAFKQYQDQYATLPDFAKKTRDIADPLAPESGDSGESAARYIARLTKNVADLKKYNETLNQLRAMGLNDSSYKNLLGQGLTGKKFAESLLLGGPASITAVNDLTGQFVGATNSLAESSQALTVVPNVLGSYQADLAAQVGAVTAYRVTLDQLRAMGLDDATYKKLLDAGTSGQEFASQLLAGGPAAVASINALDAQLQTAAQTLGYNGARNLYQAGVNAAQGIVDGLKAKQGEIYATMVRIAKEMIKALKAKLKVKSPSREMAAIGKFISLGLAQGMTASSSSVTDAATSLGASTLEAMRKSVRDISSAVMLDVDTNPTITPVLDLSQVRAEVKKMPDMTNVVPIDAAMSYTQASIISQDQQVAQAVQLDSAVQNDTSGPRTLEFKQYNSSPEALSPTEVYRLTKNQIAMAKTALGVA